MNLLSNYPKDVTSRLHGTCGVDSNRRVSDRITTKTRQVQTTERNVVHVRSKSDQYPSEMDNYLSRDKSSGANFESVVRVMPRVVHQDTFLDNEIGESLRTAKAKFGKAPFVEAYKRVLNTSKKIDDRWEEYLEKEARQRSILEEGEDSVL